MWRSFGVSNGHWTITQYMWRLNATWFLTRPLSIQTGHERAKEQERDVERVKE